MGNGEIFTRKLASVQSLGVAQPFDILRHRLTDDTQQLANGETHPHAMMAIRVTGDQTP